MVVLLGIDVDKGTHTAVAVDEVGQKIGQCVVAATDGGHRQLLGWALSRWSGDRLRFAVEDCRQVSTRLERTLVGCRADGGAGAAEADSRIAVGCPEAG